MLDKNELLVLIEKWERISRRAFCDADHEKDPMGKRLIEHGAMCYFNCSRELRVILSLSSPQPSTIRVEDQTSMRQ